MEVFFKLFEVGEELSMDCLYLLYVVHLNLAHQILLRNRMPESSRLSYPV
jgi:hypothetical protein